MLACVGDEPVVNLDKLTYAGNLRQPRLRSTDDARHVFVHGDIGDRALVAALLGDASAARDRELRRREPRRPLDRRARATFIADQRRRHLRAAGGGARATGRALPTARARCASASCTCRPTRSTARSAPTDRRSPRRRRYAPNSPYSASQGGLRPPGARVPPHLRPADADDQLLEQLRPVPVSREADPADDRSTRSPASRCRSTATARTCATGCTSSDHCAAIRARARRRARSARPTTSAATASSRTSTSCDTICALLDELRREPRRSYAALDHAS